MPQLCSRRMSGQNQLSKPPLVPDPDRKSEGHRGDQVFRLRVRDFDPQPLHVFLANPEPTESVIGCKAQYKPAPQRGVYLSLQGQTCPVLDAQKALSIRRTFGNWHGFGHKAGEKGLCLSRAPTQAHNLGPAAENQNAFRHQGPDLVAADAQFRAQSCKAHKGGNFREKAGEIHHREHPPVGIVRIARIQCPCFDQERFQQFFGRAKLLGGTVKRMQASLGLNFAEDRFAGSFGPRVCGNSVEKAVIGRDQR